MFTIKRQTNKNYFPMLSSYCRTKALFPGAVFSVKAIKVQMYNFLRLRDQNTKWRPSMQPLRLFRAHWHHPKPFIIQCKGLCKNIQHKRNISPDPQNLKCELQVWTISIPISVALWNLSRSLVFQIEAEKYNFNGVLATF